MPLLSIQIDKIPEKGIAVKCKYWEIIHQVDMPGQELSQIFCLEFRHLETLAAQDLLFIFAVNYKVNNSNKKENYDV